MRGDDRGRSCRQKARLLCPVLWLGDCVLPVSTCWVSSFIFLFISSPVVFLFFLSFLFHLSCAYWEWSGTACLCAVSQTVKIGYSKFDNSTFVYFLNAKWLCYIWVISLTVEKMTVITWYKPNFLYVLFPTHSCSLRYVCNILYLLGNWKNACINLMNLN